MHSVIGSGFKRGPEGNRGFASRWCRWLGASQARGAAVSWSRRRIFAGGTAEALASRLRSG